MKWKPSLRINKPSLLAPSCSFVVLLKGSKNNMVFKNLVFVLAAVARAATAFTITDPKTIWSQISPGWNLGNTLDAIPNEGSWNNPPVGPETFDDIKASGFKSVRIPVTWTHHFATEAPDYTVDPTFMTRVETVVDQALARGIWVVLNVHHDSWEWATLPGAPSVDYWAKVEKFEKLWKQIAQRFNSKSEKLILESLNEPAGPRPPTQADSDLYNDLNMRFLNIVRNSGGYNRNRITSIPPILTDIVYGNEQFVIPNAGDDKWTYQVHYYTPWSFVAGQWGHSSWGDATEKAEMKGLIDSLAAKFSNVPILIGEFSTSGSGKHVEKAAAWIWTDYLVRLAYGHGIAVQFWDNGNDFFDRQARAWRDPTLKDILVNAATGKVNTLPEAGYATVWVNATQTLSAKDVLLQWSGNTLVSVKDAASGTTLTSGTHYTASATGISLTPKYLQSLLAVSPVGVRGKIGGIIIKSSQGADLFIEIRRYSRPTLATTQFVNPSTSEDLVIPTTFNGAKLATVKAVKADGVFLKNDWTIWLGEPKAGRIDWGDFETDESTNVRLSAGILNTIKSSGQSATLTFEFWPRSDSANVVPVTISF